MATDLRDVIRLDGGVVRVVDNYEDLRGQQQGHLQGIFQGSAQQFGNESICVDLNLYQLVNSLNTHRCFEEIISLLVGALPRGNIEGYIRMGNIK